MTPFRVDRSFTFVLGGEKSGKSRFAVARAEEQTATPWIIATATPTDHEMEERIRRHREERGPAWRVVEGGPPENTDQIPDGSVVVLDCVTLWLAQIFDEWWVRQEPKPTSGADRCVSELLQRWALIRRRPLHLIVVSNEIGLGVHGATEGVRIFTAAQGLVNQALAADADEVYLLVAGIPLRISGENSLYSRATPSS